MEHFPPKYENEIMCLYNQHSPAIYGLLIKYVAPNKATELLLEVFTTAYKELPEAHEVRLAWLIRIACRHLRTIRPEITIELGIKT